MMNTWTVLYDLINLIFMQMIKTKLLLLTSENYHNEGGGRTQSYLRFWTSYFPACYDTTAKE